MTVMNDDDRFRGPWFDSRTACAYVCCTTMKGWYEWRKRHGIVKRANGSVAKADLDRALKVRRPARPVHPNSRANLLRSPTRAGTPAVGETRASAAAPPEEGAHE